MGRTEDKDGSPIFSLQDSVAHLLHHVAQVADDRFAELAGDALTLRQFAVLAAIAEAPGLSQVELGRAAGVDRSTLADIVARMERRGWIDRTTSLLDARAQSVHLSTAGAGVLAEAAAHAAAADDAILDLLPRAKRKSLIGTLTKLTKRLDERNRKRERQARRKAKRGSRKKKRAATRSKK